MIKNIGLIDDYAQIEAFRTLRTNLLFSGENNKAVVITSPRPADGKSTVSQQLARSLAQDSKKVVYVDCDLRRSKNIRFFKEKTAVYGITHFLSRNIPLENCIYATDLPHFHFIPSGPFPPNPTELLGSAKFKSLIKLLRDNFDYVIIDTPPIGSVIDAAVASRACDGSILVFGSNINSKQEAKLCIDAMRKANPNIIGAVLNKFNTKNNKYYGYNTYSYEESEEE